MMVHFGSSRKYFLKYSAGREQGFSLNRKISIYNEGGGAGDWENFHYKNGIWPNFLK
ncbi:hypothetical protein SK128_010814, partial [Halocaridina rubra]